MKRRRLNTKKKMRIYRILNTEGYIENVKATCPSQARRIVREGGVGVV